MRGSFERAMLLFRQSRFDLAEREFRGSLADDPNDPLAHAFLSLCLLERKELLEATREAGQAVMLAPDMSLGHFALAAAFHRRNRPEEAEQAVGEAIRLDPTDADAHALLASVRIDRRRWTEALDAAEQGLEFDPEHVGCNNLRAIALIQLGRREEAGQTIDSALSRNPEEALSHANRGWSLLHEGKARPAMEHFREALRIEPGMEWARAGIVEAMKARNPVYRVMLGYFLWMSRLSRTAQWAVLLGLILGRQVVASVARANPAIAPIAWSVLVILFIFLVMTWIAVPLFNLLLRLDRFGRLALSEDELAGSNWLAAYLGSGLVCLGFGLIQSDPRAVSAAIQFGLLLLPVGGTFLCPRGWPRDLMKTISLALTVAGPLAIAVLSSTSAESAIHQHFTRWHDLFPIGVMGSTWLAVILAQTRIRQ